MRRMIFVLMGIVVGLSSLALAQSGAPNLIQFHGRLLSPMTSQAITSPTQIRVQVIQGGTAEENPSSGRAVFAEQAEVTPDETGRFDYLIGSHAPGVGTGRARLDAEDFNTTQPVFVEIGLVQPDGSVQAVLPRHRLGSVPFALQVDGAAVDERAVNVEGDTMTGPLQILDSLKVGSGGPAQGPGDAFVAGTLQVGATSLVLTTNGIRFPDDSFQTTAGIAPDQVVRSVNGLMGNLTLAATSPITITPSGNMLTIAAPNALTTVAHNTTLVGNGTSGTPLGVAVPLKLIGETAFGGTIEGQNSTGAGAGVKGTNTVGPGVEGRSEETYGVLGTSKIIGVSGSATGTGDGVVGSSDNGVSVFAISHGTGDLFSGRSGAVIRFRVDNDGDVFAKSYTPPSDIRLKTDIEPLTDVLKKIHRLRGVSYQWIEKDPSTSLPEIGVIAQEVEAVFPELIKPWGDQGYKGVSYDGLTAVLVEGVKALKEEFEALGAEVASLRRLITELRAEASKSRN
ncbi:MAG: tail fiber domain-containing protein [Acidobacteria bacterium]|nr:tail fiber domain-containing protein [Acidobacteriota bacterium]